MKKKIAALMVLFLLLCACSCGTNGQSRFQASFFDVFDTMTTITGYAKSEAEFTETAQLAHEQLAGYHRLFDIYHTYEGINNVKTINDNAGIVPVKVDADVIEMLDLAMEMYELTDGMVNVAMGSVLSVWHEYREAGIEDPLMAKLPPMELLSEKSSHMDISDVIIDRENSTVYLRDPEMTLDVGAVAKGYAVQKTVEALIAKGVQSVILSAGGNVYAIGTRPDKTKWQVGIRDPEGASDEQLAAAVAVSDRAVVSSGSYQRYYTVDGVRYHHIISPLTLMPNSEVLSVSVITTDSGKADALSTALFNMKPSDGIALIESLPDTEAFYILADKSELYSSGYQSFSVKLN